MAENKYDYWISEKEKKMFWKITRKKFDKLSEEELLEYLLKYNNFWEFVLVQYTDPNVKKTKSLENAFKYVKIEDLKRSLIETVQSEMMRISKTNCYFEFFDQTKKELDKAIEEVETKINMSSHKATPLKIEDLQCFMAKANEEDKEEK